MLVGAVLVFAIAAAFVGSEAFRLGHETPSAIFDLDEATQEVGDELPEAVQGRLAYAEVRRLIEASLAHLESKGLAAAPGRDVPPSGASRRVPSSRRLCAAQVELRNRHCLDHSVQDPVGRHLLCKRLVTEDEPVPEGILRERGDVLDRDVVAVA